MIRTTLEITYLLTIIYLFRIYYILFINVVKLRRETKTTIGFIDKRLERAIRAHSNFCETVPLITFMSLILYFNNLLFFAVPMLILLLIGRLIHSRAISNINEKIADRRIGMRLTMYSMKLGIIGIVYYILSLVYFTFKASTNTTILPQNIINIPLFS